MRRAGSLLIAIALLAAFAVPLLLGGRDALFSSFQLSAKGYFALLALTIASWGLRAAKQGLLMRRLNLRAGAARVLAISQATELAFLATPGGVGGYAAGVLYLRGVGASYAAATAISAADQVLDLLFFAAAVPLALLFLVDAPEVGMLRDVARISSLVAALIVVAAVLARRRLGAWLFGAQDSPGLLERLPYLRRRSAQLRSFLINLRAQTGALMAGSPGFFAAIALCTALQWLTRYGVLWLIVILLGHPVPFALLFLLQGLLLHAAQWTGVPAGAGSADLGLAASLAAFVPSGDIATALLLWRFATLHLSLAAGIAAIAALRLRWSAPLAASE